MVSKYHTNFVIVSYIYLSHDMLNYCLKLDSGTLSISVIHESCCSKVNWKFISLRILNKPHSIGVDFLVDGLYGVHCILNDIGVKNRVPSLENVVNLEY